MNYTMLFQHNILKTADFVAGRLLASIIPLPSRNFELSDIKRILLIRPGGIGDAALLALPISCIKKTFPDAHITILAERRNSGTFQLIPQVDKVLNYDRPGDFVEALTTKFDLVIDTEQSHRLSAVVARMVNTPFKVGFDTNERRRMFSHTVDYDMDAYEVDNFLALLEPLGVRCQIDGATQFLSVPDLSLSRAERLLKPLNSEPFMAIFPGASIEEKRWGTEKFMRVAELIASFGIKVVAVGGKDEVRQSEAIWAGGLGLNLTGLTSLAETAAVIKKSALLLSGDSGVLHIAAGLGVPTVSLFGASMVSKWAPKGDHHIVINKGLPCSPCTTFGRTPPCPINSKCMSDITVDEVFNAVTVLLTSVGAMPSRCCKRDWVEVA
ncbi:MAG: glycosyltransferase family 9 protein [Desulfuromonadaceae bacterium]|nr:glycosyltransferase family 9 protein [Desulfuromonadaceae bacterium]MDD2854470.1 glycosyltransferase family 9 protein [Desulfuromonadaceae bacterium]